MGENSVGIRVSGGVRIVFKSVEMSSEVENYSQGLKHLPEKRFGQTSPGEAGDVYPEAAVSRAACERVATGLLHLHQNGRLPEGRERRVASVVVCI